MTTVADLVDRVLTQLYEEPTNPVHWSRAEIRDALDEAMGVIYRMVTLSSSSSSLAKEFLVVEDQSLDAGTKQTIPAPSGAMFASVTDIAGRAPTQFSTASMNAVKPDWISTTGENPRQFARDAVDPRTYWLYPGASAGQTAEVSYYTEPAPVSDSDPAPFESKYNQSLVDFALYRAYSKDTEYAGQNGRAAMHYQMFKDGLLNGSG